MRVTIIALLLVLLPNLAAGTEQPCFPSGRYFQVDTHDSRLFLCEDGQALKSFKVSLGRGGLDKKAQGDGRTPIGAYSLGAPRPSNRFFTFIPVGYPTPEQKKIGFTGSDVGVHGPFRYLSWLGSLNTWIDWTNGCIAVGSANEISEIAEWVRNAKITSITIR